MSATSKTRTLKDSMSGDRYIKSLTPGDETRVKWNIEYVVIRDAIGTDGK